MPPSEGSKSEAPASTLINWAEAEGSNTLEQASNGTSDVPISAVDWVNTRITAQEGHYVEGSSIPYRLILDPILPGTHRVVIAWDEAVNGARPSSLSMR